MDLAFVVHKFLFSGNFAGNKILKSSLIDFLDIKIRNIFYGLSDVCVLLDYLQSQAWTQIPHWILYQFMTSPIIARLYAFLCNNEKAEYSNI